MGFLQRLLRRKSVARSSSEKENERKNDKVEKAKKRDAASHVHQKSSFRHLMTCCFGRRKRWDGVYNVREAEEKFLREVACRGSGSSKEEKVLSHPKEDLCLDLGHGAAQRTYQKFVSQVSVRADVKSSFLRRYSSYMFVGEMAGVEVNVHGPNTGIVTSVSSRDEPVRELIKPSISSHGNQCELPSLKVTVSEPDTGDVSSVWNMDASMIEVIEVSVLEASDSEPNTSEVTSIWSRDESTTSIWDIDEWIGKEFKPSFGSAGSHLNKAGLCSPDTSEVTSIWNMFDSKASIWSMDGSTENVVKPRIGSQDCQVGKPGLQVDVTRRWCFVTCLIVAIVSWLLVLIC